MAQGYLVKKKRNRPSHRVLPVRGLTRIDHLVASRRLRRLAVDMASECSFAKAVERMAEHHGVELNTSLIRSLTLEAGEAATNLLNQKRSSSMSEPSQPLLITQMDGVMVPVVSFEESTDRRKTKTLHWQEMRVGTVSVPGRTDARYATSFHSADELGDRLGIQVRDLGGDHTTQIHGLGDGASWIVEQGERIGGSNYSHLIDYYHFCEYIHAAFKEDPRAKLKISRSKTEAKERHLNKVRRRLYRQLRSHPGHKEVSACIRYLANRPGQFEYHKAIARGLPIGSGQVESTNRSLIQKRLKLPGAWWRRGTAAKIACLRALRANERWEEIWQSAA